MPHLGPLTTSGPEDMSELTAHSCRHSEVKQEMVLVLLMLHGGAVKQESFAEQITTYVL